MRKPVRRDEGRPRGAPVVQSVLAHTLEELAESGLEGLSIERVAMRAGVNKTSVYRRWPTREALVTAALKSVLQGVAAPIPDSGSVHEDLVLLMSPVVELLGTPVGQALLRSACASGPKSVATALASGALRQHTRGPVRQVFERARQRKQWKKGFSAEQVTLLLVGGIVHRVLMERRPITRRWLRSLVYIAVFGITPRT
jgi:AcrR family transcriptional regulator